MIGPIQFRKGVPERVYKTFVDKIRKITSSEDADERFTVDLRGTEVDVRQLVIDMYGLTMPCGVNEEIANKLRTEDVEFITDVIHSVDAKQINFLKQVKTVRKDTAPIEEGEIDPADLNMINHLYYGGHCSNVVSSLGPVLLENQTLISDIFASLAIWSVITVNSGYKKMPNFFVFKAHILYYWMSKNINLSMMSTQIKQAEFIRHRNLVIAHDKDTVEDYLKSIYDEETSELAIKYILDLIEDPKNSIPNNIEECLRLYKEYSDDNPLGKKLLIKAADDVAKNLDTSIALCCLLDKRNFETYMRVAAVCSAVSDSIPTVTNILAIYPYLFYKATLKKEKGQDRKLNKAKAKAEKEGKEFDIDEFKNNSNSNSDKMTPAEVKYASIYNIILNIAHKETYALYSEFSSILASYESKSIKTIYKLTEDLNKANNNLSKQTDKLQDTRSKLKETTKGLSRAEAKIKEIERNLEKVIADTEHSIKQSDFDEVVAERDSVQAALEVKYDEAKELGRQLNRREREMAALIENKQAMTTTIQELESKLRESERINRKLAIHRAFNEIPIERFVNAIKNKNIVVIGGNMTHAKLRSYGFNNLRCYEAGYRGITFETISDADLVVIVTSYVDHSSIEGVVYLANTHNIPLLQFNKKNVEMLIYAMFNELNK